MNHPLKRIPIKCGLLMLYVLIVTNGLHRQIAVSTHLKMTGTRHVMNFINHGNYDKKTGLKEMNRPESNFNLSDN
jgi:hypothetical protein